MWSLALSNIDPQLSKEELLEFFKLQPVRAEGPPALPSLCDLILIVVFVSCAQGGGSIFSTQVLPDPSDSSKAQGFVHYLSSEAYASALEDSAEVDIKGRLAKAFPADDKRKVYVRNLPPGIRERELRSEIERITGPCDSINLSNKGGQTTHPHARLVHQRVSSACSCEGLKECEEGECRLTGLMGPWDGWQLRVESLAE
jgi:hypothetical protein